MVTRCTRTLDSRWLTARAQFKATRGCIQTCFECFDVIVRVLRAIVVRTAINDRVRIRAITTANFFSVIRCPASVDLERTAKSEEAK